MSKLEYLKKGVSMNLIQRPRLPPERCCAVTRICNFIWIFNQPDNESFSKALTFVTSLTKVCEQASILRQLAAMEAEAIEEASRVSMKAWSYHLRDCDETENNAAPRAAHIKRSENGTDKNLRKTKTLKTL
ncbi:hypothetical protein GF323_03050 [Candidatus Woesearchaeota archaeon]|nr:hypothetical protein [Candidatus Woesearchaeota archaeon]